MKYTTSDARVSYLLSSCRSAVCHRTFYKPFVRAFSTTGDSYNLWAPYSHMSSHFWAMSSNLSEEWANAKDLCNKLPDKSVRVCNAYYASTFYTFTLLLCLAMRDAFLRVLSGALPCIIAWVVVWQGIVRSILQALTGPETCWHKALTDFLRMFSTNLWFHTT